MKRHLLHSVGLLLLVAASAAGCAGELPPDTPRVEPTTAPVHTEDMDRTGETAPVRTAAPTEIATREAATMTPTPTPRATEVAAQNEAERFVQLAREDLSQRLDLALEEIRPASVEAVNWPDASLGCPQPGMLYAQAITPGFAIVLEAGGQIYGYHTDSVELVVLCPEEPSSRDEPAVMTETPAPSEGDLPIFVEMTQVTIIPSATPQSVPVAGRPNSLFAYIPGSRTLLLRPGITVAPTAKVLVALAQVIQGPTGELVRGDLFHVPGSDTPPLEVADIDYATGALQLVYNGETLELAPGESRTFERTLADQGPVEITMITNHGCLAAIGALPGEGIGR